MKNKYRILIHLCVLIGIVIFGACTKKEETPAPQVNSLPEYYFIGTLGKDSIKYQGNSTNNSNQVIGAGGVFADPFVDGQYNYGVGYDAYWIKSKTNQPNDIETILSINCVRNIFNVDKNFVYSDKGHYDLWQTSKIFPRQYKPYSNENGNFMLNISEYSWGIGYRDEITGKSWGSQIDDNSEGYIVITSKENVIVGGFKYVKVTGYILCKMYEDNNTSNFKILKGSFSQLANGYYDLPSPE